MSILTQVYKKVFNAKKAGPIDLLIKEGFLKIGQGCKLDGLQVQIVDMSVKAVNVEIGDNCCLLGAIIIYKSGARVKIGNNVYIGPGTLLECVEGIEIGDNVLISGNCNLVDNNSHSLDAAERDLDTLEWQKGLLYKNWDVVDKMRISIKSRCWIGLRSIILKGVNLQEGVVVGAGSVVTKNVEAYTVVAGNPAKFIKKI